MHILLTIKHIVKVRKYSKVLQHLGGESSVFVFALFKAKPFSIFAKLVVFVKTETATIGK